MGGFGIHWPNGLSEEVAVIGASIDYIEERLNISFNEDFDDLDVFKYYVFEFDKGHCALMRYNNAQISGVTLVIEKDHLSEVDEFVKYFLDELCLSDCSVIWRRS